MKSEASMGAQPGSKVQRPNPDSMKKFTDTADSFVTAHMAKQQIPGLAVAGVDDGRPVFAKGYGLANVEHAQPVTKDTVFPILSITKTFTATAVMMLVEQGRLALEDPIREYLPTTPDAWRGISVRHLISHMSGLTDVYNDLPEEEWPDPSQREAYAQFIAHCILQQTGIEAAAVLQGRQHQYGGRGQTDRQNPTTAVTPVY